MFKFFCINCIFSFIVFLFYLFRKRKDAYIRLIIMTFLPVGGLLIYCALDIYWIIIDKNGPLNYLEAFSKGTEIDSFSMRKSNIEKEINVIPIEEALILNDNTTKRTLIIEVLKNDTYQYIGFLTKALKDSDTETSHYAATAVTEIKRKLMLAIQMMEVRYEESKNDIEYLKAYSDVLKKYLESGLLDDRDLEKYSINYVNVLKNILDLGNMEEFYFEEKVNYDIRLQRFDTAIEYCMMYKNYLKDSDKPYILLLKIYYTLKNKEAFNKVLNELTKSNIKLKRESLRIVRFWLKGV